MASFFFAALRKFCTLATSRANSTGDWAWYRRNKATKTGRGNKGNLSMYKDLGTLSHYGLLHEDYKRPLACQGCEMPLRIFRFDNFRTAV